MRTVFMGTPEFAAPCLSKLLENHEVAAVITQPDRPKGRGKKLQPPPVKIFAESKGLQVFQPEKVRSEEFYNIMRQIAPELIIVVAFGKILPKEILLLPPKGCVNVHASLLPKYRGAAPVARAIMAGEAETGVTTMMMDAGLDTGDMLMSRKIPIAKDETRGTLKEKLSALGAELLIKTLHEIEAGSSVRVKQNADLATYAEKITRETGKINWTRPAGEIHNLVRALDPEPGAFTSIDGKIFKIWRTEVDEGSGEPGEILSSEKKELKVAAGSGAIRIVELQIPGKKRMNTADFLRGSAPPAGKFL